MNLINRFYSLYAAVYSNTEKNLSGAGLGDLV